MHTVITKIIDTSRKKKVKLLRRPQTIEDVNLVDMPTSHIASDRNIAEPLLMNTSDRSERSTEHGQHARYMVYRERWLVLLVCVFLALSNAMQWISYSSLLPQAQTYFRNQSAATEGTNFSVSWVTNEIFQAMAVLTGLGGMYITDHFGIMPASLLGTCVNLIGSLIRLISSIPWINNFLAREIILHAGSVVTAIAQSFFLILPSKIAECWFADDQRAIANVLSFIANPAGVALGTVVPSLLFTSDQIDPDSWKFFIYGAGMSVLALVPFGLSLFMRNSLPPSPPSASCAHEEDILPFFESIKICMKNLQFLIQMLIFGLEFSLLWSLMMFSDQVLVNQGYNLKGYPTAVCAIIGTLTSLLFGHLADKTKRFKEILRFCNVGFACSTIVFRWYVQKTYEEPCDAVVIFVLVGLMGAFSIPQFPLGVEMGVETTFPVLEATSSGLLVIFGQLSMFLVGFLFEAVSTSDMMYPDKKAKYGKNTLLVLDVGCAMALFSVLLSSVFMNPRYKRIELEMTGTTVMTDDKEISKAAISARTDETSFGSTRS